MKSLVKVAQRAKDRPKGPRVEVLFLTTLFWMACVVFCLLVSLFVFEKEGVLIWVGGVPEGEGERDS